MEVEYWRNGSRNIDDGLTEDFLERHRFREVGSDADLLDEHRGCGAAGCGRRKMLSCPIAEGLGRSSDGVESRKIVGHA